MVDLNVNNKYFYAENIECLNNYFPNLSYIINILTNDSSDNFSLEPSATCSYGFIEDDWHNIISPFLPITKLDCNKPCTLIQFKYKITNIGNAPSLIIRVHYDIGIYISIVSSDFNYQKDDLANKIFERYFIPWDDIERHSIKDIAQYQTYHISDIDFLLKSNQHSSKYKPIHNNVWTFIFKNLIYELKNVDERIIQDNMFDFIIYGIAVRKRFIALGMVKYHTISRDFGCL